MKSLSKVVIVACALSLAAANAEIVAQGAPAFERMHGMYSTIAEQCTNAASTVKNTAQNIIAPAQPSLPQRMYGYMAEKCAKVASSSPATILKTYATKASTKVSGWLGLTPSYYDIVKAGLVAAKDKVVETVNTVTTSEFMKNNVDPLIGKAQDLYAQHPMAAKITAGVAAGAVFLYTTNKIMKSFSKKTESKK